MVSLSLPISYFLLLPSPNSFRKLNGTILPSALTIAPLKLPKAVTEQLLSFRHVLPLSQTADNGLHCTQAPLDFQPDMSPLKTPGRGGAGILNKTVLTLNPCGLSISSSNVLPTGKTVQVSASSVKSMKLVFSITLLNPVEIS